MKNYKRHSLLTIELTSYQMVIPVADLIYMYGWDFDRNYNRHDTTIYYGFNGHRNGGFIHLVEEDGKKKVLVSGMDYAEDDPNFIIHKLIKDVELFKFKVGDYIKVGNALYNGRIESINYAGNIMKIKMNNDRYIYSDLNGNERTIIESMAMRNIGNSCINCDKYKG